MRNLIKLLQEPEGFGLTHVAFRRVPGRLKKLPFVQKRPNGGCVCTNPPHIPGGALERFCLEPGAAGCGARRIWLRADPSAAALLRDFYMPVKVSVRALRARACV